MSQIPDRRQVFMSRSPESVPEDPVSFWLSRLDEDSWKSCRSHLNRWITWLRKQKGWEDVTPRRILLKQLEAGDPYRVLDMVQSYIGQLRLRKTSKEKALSTIKSFFSHNRCALPGDPSYRIRSDKAPVQAKLSLEDVLAACRAANLRYRSMILFKFQSMVDNARLEYVCRNCAGQIVRQLEDKMRPMKIDLPGRKSNENDPEGSFYTFVGSDAVNALIEYFEKERGYPKEGEPVWIKSDGSPVTDSAFTTTWIRLFRRIGTIPKRKGPPGSRYGYNPHEMRDVATTLLHLKAKSDGFDMDCAKFWSGRVGTL